MKRFLWGVAALILAPGAAQAADNGFFLSAFGGVSVQTGQSSEGTTVDGTPITLDVDFDPGIGVGGAVGYRFDIFGPGNVRVELEVSYREGDVESAEIDGTGQLVGLDNSSLGVLANVVYEFSLTPLIKPYAGLGFGVGGVESDLILAAPGGDIADPDFTFDGGTETELLYQIIFGATIPLSERFEFFIDGRFFAAADPEFELLNLPDESLFAETDSDFEVFHVNLGFRFNF